MEKALSDVLKERERQDEKWGVQDHGAFVWITILVEEIGEFTEAALKGYNLDVLRKEAVQMAAVALAIIECIDRVER